MVIWMKRPGGRDADRLCGRREAAAIEAAGCVFRVVGDMRRKQDDFETQEAPLSSRRQEAIFSVETTRKIPVSLIDEHTTTVCLPQHTVRPPTSHRPAHRAHGGRGSKERLY